MVSGFGIAKSPPVDESDLQSFIATLSQLPADQWQKRITVLKDLVDSIPDYSTTPLLSDDEKQQQQGSNSNSNSNNSRVAIIAWYRSSKSVRRLAMPLKTLLLDARSAVVKVATELIGTLLMVKLQPHPSLTMAENGTGGARSDAVGEKETIQSNGGLETINGGLNAPNKLHEYGHKLPPPPAFVGRLLLKDLLPSILDMSKQTVKTIRTYGVSMMNDILPHCRVKSTIVILLERMKTHANRTVREDCARYLRCVLETWPWDSTGSCDNISNTTNEVGGIIVNNSRKEERLSLDLTRQIGLGLGRTLSDSAKPVREEAKRGFNVLFARFRPVWDEAMASGVVRDVRLRKKLLDAASRCTDNGNTNATTKKDGNNKSNLFDDMASLGEMSLNSAVSGMSYRSTMSNRSYASRGMVASGSNHHHGVPSMIGTPKVTSPRMRSRARYSPGGPNASSPSYMRGTGSSSTRISEQAKLHAKEGSSKCAVNEYVTSSGHVVKKTPSPRKRGNDTRPTGLYEEREDVAGAITTQQPFASLLHTPNRSPADNVHYQYLSPESKQKSCKVLRKRLSRRISGIKEDEHLPQVLSPTSQLTSISEAEDHHHHGTQSASVKEVDGSSSSEIINVALEVIAAHLSHLEQIESLVAREKEVLTDLSKQLGTPISDGMKAAELAEVLGSLTEEEVCDYFESVHVCVDKQRDAGEKLIFEMEKISEGGGDVSTLSGGVTSPDLPQSPLDEPNFPSVQRDLKDEF